MSKRNQQNRIQQQFLYIGNRLEPRAGPTHICIGHYGFVNHWKNRTMQEDNFTIVNDIQCKILLHISNKHCTQVGG